MKGIVILIMTKEQFACIVYSCGIVPLTELQIIFKSKG